MRLTAKNKKPNGSLKLPPPLLLFLLCLSESVLYVSLSYHLSHCCTVSLSLSFRLYLSLLMSVSLLYNLSVFICLYLYLCISVFFCLPISLSKSLCLSVTLFHCLSIFFHYLSICLFTCVFSVELICRENLTFC